MLAPMGLTRLLGRTAALALAGVAARHYLRRLVPRGQSEALTGPEPQAGAEGESPVARPTDRPLPEPVESSAGREEPVDDIQAAPARDLRREPAGDPGEDVNAVVEELLSLGPPERRDAIDVEAIEEPEGPAREAG